MLKALVKLRARPVGERGATAVEYGLMVALIAVVIMGAVTALGGNLSTIFQNVSDAIAAVIPAAP